MANKKINDLSQKTNVTTTDKVVIAETGGDHYKVSQENLLKTTGDMTVFRGTTKEFDVGNNLFEILSTGVFSFAGLGINADTSKFDVGAAEGHIVDFEAGTYDLIDYEAETALTPATSNGVTYVLINKSGNLDTQTTQPTDEERRDSIYLGRVITDGGVVIQVQDEPVLITNPAEQAYDLAKALRVFNIDGNVISANGSNLNINKSAGHLFSVGVNFTTNAKEPNKVTIASSTAGSFKYITQTAGSAGSSTALIDPSKYDNAGTPTTINPTANKATIQRVYLFPSGELRIAYGQTVYSKLADAVQAVSSESFTVNPSIPGNGILIAIVVLRADATDLSDSSQARILTTSRFGESSVGAAGQSVSSLQNAYDNSVEPEILVTDTTNGAVTIKDSVSNTNRDNIFEVRDTSNNVVFGVDRNGFTAGLDSGTYTPTVSNESGDINSVVVSGFKYMRIGNIVTVTGLVDIRQDTEGTADFELSLPIASNMTATSDLTGTAGKGRVSYDEFDASNIEARPATDNAKLEYNIIVSASPGFGSVKSNVSFTYEVK